MQATRKQRHEFDGKIIDVHSHVGMHAAMYRDLGYPWGQSVEDLYYRQVAGGIDVNVIFPFGSCPDTSFPYEVDNRRLMRELHDFCPELSDRFLPFVCIDTARQVSEQITLVTELAAQYPVYGIKINPVDRQSPVSTLRSQGQAVLDLACRMDLPLIFHSVPAGLDQYSPAEEILDIARQTPSARFCLTHSLLFCRDLLDQADSLPNVWVDTAALKIQVDLARELLTKGRLNSHRLITRDLSDHHAILRLLADRYPDLILWGTDSPAYTFHTRRQQGENTFYDFKMKGRYEDEVSALRALDGKALRRVANENTLKYLFG